MALKLADWSTTPASNTSVDGIAISENCPFANLNNAIRSTMSAVKYEVAAFGAVVASASKPDIAIEGGCHSVSGTTTITGFATAPAGLIRTLIFETAVQLVHSTSLIIPASVPFTTGAGTLVRALSRGSGNWSIEIVTRGGTPIATPPSFRAHKNGTDQAVVTVTNTTVTFGTESWDVGGFFASNAWTPSAGKYRITVNITWTATNGVDNESLWTELHKDGVADSQLEHKRNGTGRQSFSDSFEVIATGSNAFTVVVFKGGAGDGEIEGMAAQTYFAGDQAAHI